MGTEMGWGWDLPFAMCFSTRALASADCLTGRRRLHMGQGTVRPTSLGAVHPWASLCSRQVIMEHWGHVKGRKSRDTMQTNMRLSADDGRVAGDGGWYGDGDGDGDGIRE